MMYEYTFRESSCLFFFLPLLTGDQLIKEGICSLKSKFFPSRVDPILEVLFGGFIKLEVPKVVSLSKYGRKHDGVPIHLKAI